MINRDVPKLQSRVADALVVVVVAAITDTMLATLSQDAARPNVECRGKFSLHTVRLRLISRVRDDLATSTRLVLQPNARLTVEILCTKYVETHRFSTST